MSSETEAAAETSSPARLDPDADRDQKPPQRRWVVLLSTRTILSSGTDVELDLNDPPVRWYLVMVLRPGVVALDPVYYFAWQTPAYILAADRSGRLLVRVNNDSNEDRGDYLVAQLHPRNPRAEAAVLYHGGQLWLALAYGVIVCDPFAATSHLHLRLVPLPGDGETRVELSQINREYVLQRRRVAPSEGLLRRWVAFVSNPTLLLDVEARARAMHGGTNLELHCVRMLLLHPHAVSLDPGYFAFQPSTYILAADGSGHHLVRVGLIPDPRLYLLRHGDRLLCFSTPTFVKPLHTSVSPTVLYHGGRLYWLCDPFAAASHLRFVPLPAGCEEMREELSQIDRVYVAQRRRITPIDGLLRLVSYEVYVAPDVAPPPVNPSISPPPVNLRSHIVFDCQPSAYILAADRSGRCHYLQTRRNTFTAVLSHDGRLCWLALKYDVVWDPRFVPLLADCERPEEEELTPVHSTKVATPKKYPEYKLKSDSSKNTFKGKVVYVNTARPTFGDEDRPSAPANAVQIDDGRPTLSNSKDAFRKTKDTVARRSSSES